jgi:hypothetical protein
MRGSIHALLASLARLQGVNTRHSSAISIAVLNASINEWSFCVDFSSAISAL